LRTLANERVSRDETRQALTDVDEEVARLNRVVNDVLDFARPIRFDYAPADVNALCADAEQATRAGHPDMHVTITLDPALETVVTDAERLRIALVNILANARQAVAARSSAIAQPDIEIATYRGPDSFRITIRDRGVGVKPEDLTRVFDPYFTTRRTGSGLGLAIAKNIIEGMGGSVSLDSRPGDGTDIRIDLPAAVRQTPANYGEAAPTTREGTA
jgi:signal transduction histidine kinase